MTFHNILSNKKEEEKIKIKITVDIHEKNSLVPSELVRLNCHVVFEPLKVGDYLAGSTLIERKTFADLQSSILSKRIFLQLEALKQSQKRMLIVEGESNLILSENAIRGFFISCIEKFDVPIVRTANEKETASYLMLLAREKKEASLNLRFEKPKESKEDKILYVLEGFPEIGPKKARELLEKFGSLSSVINAPEKELEMVLGKSAANFKELCNYHVNLPE